MAAVEADRGRAMCTEVKCSGSVPKALERWTRRVAPPRERWTIWRRVASSRSAAGRAFCGSGICCEAAHVATHVCAVVWAAAGSIARRKRMASAKIFCAGLKFMLYYSYQTKSIYFELLYGLRQVGERKAYARAEAPFVAGMRWPRLKPWRTQRQGQEQKQWRNTGVSPLRFASVEMTCFCDGSFWSR